jgi:hypothetical protein
MAAQPGNAVRGAGLEASEATLLHMLPLPRGPNSKTLSAAWCVLENSLQVESNECRRIAVDVVLELGRRMG